MSKIKFTEAHIKKICEQKGYKLPNTTDMIFIGIRGASPVNEKDQSFYQTNEVSKTPVNYQTMNCTLGQWDQKTKRIAIYPGSTVPHISSVANAKNKGGQGANQLIKGFWSFVKGVHNPRPSTAHLAFVQNESFKVQRSSDDLDYDIHDPVSSGIMWDNLHSAWSGSTDYYASAGCQVISGMPKCKNNLIESGPWKIFRERAYSIPQKVFYYILIDFDDLQKIVGS